MAQALIITVGEASTSKKHAEVGDQSQTAVPDFSGEVLMRRYTDESSFIKRFHIENDFKVLRLIDPEWAADAARYMIEACNNPHIGYILGGKGMICAGGTNTTSTTVDCGTDCSELVSQCVSQAIGRNIYAYCGNMQSTFTKAGLVKYLGPFVSYTETPIYTGDIMLKWVPNYDENGNPTGTGSGHAAMIVGGNPREGTSDELLEYTSQQEPEEASDSGEEKEEDKTPTKTEVVVQERELYKINKLFEPRRKAPRSDDKGYKFYNQSYGATKNGSYAWGRFSEIANMNCTLSKGSPRRWFNNTEDGYKRSMAPSLGAVMCFTNIYNSASPGYVCVVEYIQDNYIYTSQYSLQGEFEYQKRSKEDGSWDMDLDKDGKNEYIFQGFIYNSAVDLDYLGIKSTLQKFIDVAKEQQGTGPEFTRKYGGMDTANQGWSAGFIRAVASKSGGLLGVVLPDTLSCSAIGNMGVTLGLGTWIDGPSLGGKPNPQVGDIALFREHITTGRLKYAADKAGIVIEVSSSGIDSGSGVVKYSFKVIMGDCNGKVDTKPYTTLSQTLSGLYRPDWGKVDSIAVSPQTIEALYGMYTEEATVEDAAIRDLRYLKAISTKKNNSITTQFKPSISKTGIKLCAINYTGMLANLYGAFAEMDEYLQRREEQLNGKQPVPNTSDSTSRGNKKKEEENEKEPEIELKGNGSVVVKGKKIVANSTFKTIYSELRDYLGNDAGAIGIMGNMVQESDLCTNSVNNNNGIGLCGWNPTDRGEKMKKFCIDYSGEDWESNLMGQLKFIESELDGKYKKVRNSCKSVQEVLQGALSATEVFMENYEYPEKFKEELSSRTAFTKGVWSLVFGDSKYE